MTIAWGNLKEYILQGILKDVPNVDANSEEVPVRVFTDPELLTWARWAMSEISFNHAERATMTFRGDGAVYQFDIPDDVVDSIERTALLILPDADSGNDEVLVPVRLTPGAWWPTDRLAQNRTEVHGFWEWPAGRICLTFVPRSNVLITMHYFKTWQPPEGDASILTFPRWMEQPLAYLIGAYACDPLGMQASNIRQWNRKSDSGTPEHNPLHKQSKFFLDQATRLLVKAGTQDRDNYYRMRDAF